MIPSRSRVKIWLGTALDLVFPALGRDISSGVSPERYIRLKRCIIHSRTVRARQRGDTDALQKVLSDGWRINNAESFYDKFTDRFDHWFLGPHYETIDELRTLAQKTQFNRLIEIGCGDGRVLEHCAVVLPDITQAIGIDINPMIIERNRQVFSDNPHLSFTSADASDWLDANMQDGTIVMTYGGVMEYFSSAALSSMFKAIAIHDRVAVALVEPVDPDHDLANDLKSHTFGSENSLSHNHAALLSETGFRIVFSKALSMGGVSWMMILAEKRSPP
ncbi:methyltransferase domain-containing protein [Roseovarius sp. S1116L3]|uniref:methyltransferase domain-containing protein n=1 Tax=Roseovarius roseus TaxID=3342636 RepID=UPI003727E4DE